MQAANNLAIYFVQRERERELFRERRREGGTLANPRWNLRSALINYRSTIITREIRRR